jgi:hypothetical protein
VLEVDGNQRSGRGPGTRSNPAAAAGRGQTEFSIMLDIVMVAIALGFFALSVAYVFACDEL